MPTIKKTISVRLNEPAKRQMEKAARIMRQSSGAFLEKAGEERAQRVLLEWAVEQYKQDKGSLSQLAEETGLAVETIMDALGRSGQDEALEMFLASCRTVSYTSGKKEFLRAAEKAVKAIRETTI
jgi:hypothetical protein